MNLKNLDAIRGVLRPRSHGAHEFLQLIRTFLYYFQVLSGVGPTNSSIKMYESTVRIHATRDVVPV